MRWLLFLAIASAAACGLPDDPNKQTCVVQRDCLDGYVCDSGRCLLPGQGADLGDLGVGADGPPPDLSPAPPGKLGERCGASGCESGLTCDDAVCRRGRWAAVSAMPTARHSLAAVAAPDGRIYAIGGYGDHGALGTVEAYTPSSNSWTTLAPLNVPRYGLAAVLGPDGKIYAIGGPYQSVSSDGVSHTVEIYDIAANQWSTGPALVTGRMDVRAVTAGGRVWAIGGNQLTSLTDLATMESLAPGESVWTTASFSMTQGRSAFGAALVPDGRVFAIAGANDLNKLASVEFFTPGTNGWNTSVALPLAAEGLGAAVAGDGRLYAIGGTCYGVGGCTAPPEQRTVYSIDASGGSWEQAASMPTARFGMGVTTTADGRIWALGGDGGSILPTVEVFTP
jgi:N-acetylneuraminic acid mutarotase